MPTFDIVSKVDLAEVDNALGNIAREISTRFDFKNSHCSIERNDHTLTLLADDQTKMKQMHELLLTHFTRRKLEAGSLEFKDPEKASGDTVRQTIVVREGIDRDLAKKIVAALKDSKMKVQAAVQGDELRITGKKRDDLQAAIQHIKGLKLEQPLQYVNFRD